MRQLPCCTASAHVARSTDGSPAWNPHATFALVTKPSIAGFGLNFQHAADQVFVGLGDSYESYYQAIRRSWRFGQTRPVHVHVVVSDLEHDVVANVRAKERNANEITDRLVRSLQRNREIHA